MSFAHKPLIIAGRTFHSRLISGTVVLRRADLSGKKDPFANILEFIDPKKYLLLPMAEGRRSSRPAKAKTPGLYKTHCRPLKSKCNRHEKNHDFTGG